MMMMKKKIRVAGTVGYSSQWKMGLIAFQNPDDVTRTNLPRLEWHFPPTGGGVAQGFNDSSEEFFKANVMEHVVREIIQNSLDAKDARYPERPVIVRMSQGDVVPDIINWKGLAKHVEKALERVLFQGNKKGATFYRVALKALQKGRIPILRMTDENTTGLRGSKWDALVYQEGTPDKSGINAAGGSYGIGKNAPYAASGLGLVCYSTRYLDRHRVEKFIARCKLVAHGKPESEGGEELQHVGFGTVGVFDGRRFPPIEGNQIHDAFRLKKSGSGIFIIGFTENGWKKTARRSIAKNFFAAIHDRKLSVLLDGEDITNETLYENFDTDRQYYNLYRNADEPIKITGKFGEFCLKLDVGGESMRNRVAYVNRRGMLITDEKPFRRNPFSARIGDIGKYVAIMWAADDKTDARVRTMEPPTHETIEFERIECTAEREKTEAELRIINGIISEHIKAKLDIQVGQTTNLTELADIIPFDDDPDSGNRPGAKHSNENDTIEYKKIRMAKNTIVSAENPDGEVDADCPDGTGTDSAGGSVSSGNGRQINGKTTANMKDVRIVRSGDMLRVAFTTKSKANKFAIRPAGEENKAEAAMRITSVTNVNPCGEPPRLLNDIITIDTVENERVILDVMMDKGVPYTGYSIMEYATRRRKK